jgi:serine/threonine protein kinase
LGFKGKLSLNAGDSSNLLRIGISAFAGITKTTAFVSFSNLQSLETIESAAFLDYKGILILDGGAKPLESFPLLTSVDRTGRVFDGTNNTDSIIHLPNIDSVPILEVALANSDFGGTIEYGAIVGCDEENGDVPLTQELYERMKYMNNEDRVAKEQEISCVPANEFINYGSNVTLGTLPNLVKIAGSAFHGFANTLTIGAMPTLTIIGHYAFSAPSGTITIGAMPSLTAIHHGAFSSTSGKITIVAGECKELLTIERFAFQNVINTESVVAFGATPALATIGRGLFENFKGVLDVSFGDMKELKVIPLDAFHGVSTTSSAASFGSLPSLQLVAGSAFRNFAGVLTFAAGDCSNLTVIEASAFDSVSNLESSIIFGATAALTTIGASAFKAVKGALIFAAGDVPSFTKFESSTFAGVSNSASSLIFTNLKLLGSINTAAFNAYTGTLLLSGGPDFPQLDGEYAVATNAFDGTSNTASIIILPQEGKTRNLKTKLSGIFGGTVIHRADPGSPCNQNVTGGIYASSASAGVWTECTANRTSACHFHCCKPDVDLACRSCGSDGNCYDLAFVASNSDAANKQRDVWPNRLVENEKMELPVDMLIGGTVKRDRGTGTTISVQYKLQWSDGESPDDKNAIGVPPPQTGLVDPRDGKDPGLVSVNKYTGEVSGAPGIPGNFTMWLIAYEVDGNGEPVHKQPDVPNEFDEVVLAVWNFQVIAKPTFNLVLVPAANSTVVLPRTKPISKSTRKFTDPTLSNYFVGYTYKFAPRTVDDARTTVSKLFVDNITYTLSDDAPDSMYVQAKNGVMFGEFEEARTYTFQLIAVDAGGQKQVVENCTFKVTKRGKFAVEVDAFDYTTTQLLPGNRNVAADQYSNLDDSEKVYVVGKTYRFPPVTIASVINTQDTAGQIGFTMVGMDGFLIDPTDGYIQGTPSSEGTFNMSLFAVDSQGNQAPIGKSSTALVYKRSDTNVPSYGPNGTVCVNNGAPVDGVEFDKSFTCDCTGLQFTGNNCEIATLAPSVVSASMVAGSLVGAFAIVLAVLYVAYKFRIHHIQMQAIDFEVHVRRLIESGELDIQMATGAAAERVAKMPREIKRDHLTLIETIGKGAFGAVWKCTLDETSAGGTPSYLVAAKTVLDISSKPEARDELVSEAIVMAQLTGHLNVVSLVGVITRGDPLVLILSYCEHGSLLSYVREQHAAGTEVKMEIKRRLLMEVACGMQHLAVSRYIHRDLAARNVLIASGLVAKVADFGLSRNGKASKDVSEEDDAEGGAADYYRSKTGQFPVRWTSPEAMNTGVFTTASDVWSFAIVAVEAIQNGNQPYGDWSVSFTMTRVIGGFKHKQPADCPDDLYAIMLPCWENTPTDRPSFGTLATALRASMRESPAPAPTTAITGASAATATTTATTATPSGTVAETSVDGAGYYPAAGNNSSGGAVGANQPSTTSESPPPLPPRPEIAYHQSLYSRMNTANGESGHATAAAQLALLPTIPLVTLEAAAQSMAAHCKEDLDIEVKVSTTFANVYVVSERGRRHARGMNAIDVAVIHLYTREGPVYKYMNGALGGWGKGGTAVLASYMPYVRLLTVAMSKLPEVELTCYRGVTGVPLEVVLQGCGVGGILRSNAVTSCSASPDVLQDPVFLGFDPSNQEFGQRVVFVIQVKTGVRVEHFSDKGKRRPRSDIVGVDVG